MSTALEFKGYLCWGSNGMIADYLEQMAHTATMTASPEDKLARWLNHQYQNFYPGAVIVLDGIILEEEIATQFVTLLDEGTDTLLESGRFSEIGKQWLRKEMPRLRSHIHSRQ